MRSVSLACALTLPWAPTACGSAHTEPRHVDVVSTDAGAPKPALVLKREVTTGRIVFVYRASAFSNLVYQIDCMSGLMPCSRQAFEALWTSTLGLDDQDRAALREWAALHLRYSAQIHRSDEPTTPPPLPIWRTQPRSLDGRLLLCAYSAQGEADFLSRLALFVEPLDVEHAEQVVDRFKPRFERFWATRVDELADTVAAFARVTSRPEVLSTVDGVARFYEPELASLTRLTVELIARPEHDSTDHGQQLGDHAFAEVLPHKSAESRLDVILHELFHAWFAAATPDKQRALVQRFADSTDPLALVGYGVLNEALATALGNGLIGRLASPGDYENRMKKPLGLYHDRYVDPVAKAMVPVLDARLAAKKTLYGEDFFAEYMRVVKAALPDGAGPIAYLRPMASVYEHALADAERHLYDVVTANWIESEDDFTSVGAKLLREHPKWGTVLAVTSGHVDLLKNLPEVVTPKVLALLAKETKKSPFVLMTRRAGAGPLFVMVSASDAEMRTLVDRFGALDELNEGIWRP